MNEYGSAAQSNAWPSFDFSGIWSRPVHVAITRMMLR